MKVIKWFISLGFKISMFIVFLVGGIFCCSTTMILILANQQTMSQVENQEVVTGQGYGHEDVAKLVFADNIEQLRMTGGHHADGFSNGMGGYDYTTYCGATLYSPVAGSAVVTYNGMDGVYADNTMITIVGKAGEANLLHGNFDEVSVGDTVVGGITPIGTNASRGNSSGCHVHQNFKPSSDSFVQAKNVRGGRGQFEGYKIAVSHYTPYVNGVIQSGTTNCDSDCSTTASGDKVASWAFGRNGIKGAACPPELPFRTRFMLSGQVYECIDRGGYIQARTVGEYDPALKRNATENYFWVDLLDDDAGFSYGQLTDDWMFVK